MGHKRHGHGAAHLSHVPARPTSPHSTAPAADQQQQGGVGQCFSPQQLQAMLGKRPRMLGAGACGKVFAGELPGVGRVAVKVASANGIRALTNEAAVLQHIRHPCVVKALGSCWTEQCKAIVYEYLQSGTLDEQLGAVSTIDSSAASSGRATSCDAGMGQSYCKAARPCFDWCMRVRAAYQLACALAHLHNSVPHVLHRDIKPGNVLLDTELNAYLGDMGIAKMLDADPCSGPVAGMPPGWAGTPGYIDPMYEQLGQICDKSDVYALGVIMCQLLLDSADPHEAKRILKHAVHQHTLHLPPHLAHWPMPNALRFGELALAACQHERGCRPTARQLMAALRPLLLEAALPGMGMLQPGLYGFASERLEALGPLSSLPAGAAGATRQSAAESARAAAGSPTIKQGMVRPGASSPVNTCNAAKAQPAVTQQQQVMEIQLLEDGSLHGVFIQHGQTPAAGHKVETTSQIATSLQPPSKSSSLVSPGRNGALQYAAGAAGALQRPVTPCAAAPAVKRAAAVPATCTTSAEPTSKELQGSWDASGAVTQHVVVEAGQGKPGWVAFKGSFVDGCLRGSWHHSTDSSSSSGGMLSHCSPGSIGASRHVQSSNSTAAAASAPAGRLFPAVYGLVLYRPPVTSRASAAASSSSSLKSCHESEPTATLAAGAAVDGSGCALQSGSAKLEAAALCQAEKA